MKKLRRKNQHVVPHKDGWAVKGAETTRITSVYRTQEEAINKAREIARNQRREVVIHRRDGTIRKRELYVNNPEKNIQIKFGLHSAEESLLEEIERIKAYCNKHNIPVKEIILEVPVSLHKYAEEAIKRIDSEKKLSIRIGNFQDNKNKWELCIRVQFD